MQDPSIAEKFQDLHPPFAPQAARVEADRCLNCFDAPCTAACPTHIDVPKFIGKIARENLRGSALTILDANVLGASCSRACPVDVLCEGACVLHRYNRQPIEIARLQRFAMDAFHAAGGVLPRKVFEDRSGKIACIGGGPASLACAAELRQRGHAVTLFERRALPGGLNTYGVAEYKLPARASLEEIELIRKLGVEFRCETKIATEADLLALEKEFDAIFLGVGLGPAHRLGIPGDDHRDVIDALQFIAQYKTAHPPQVAESVAVIGAGNTAIDAANAARRLGATNVAILYRRSERHMSAFSFEYEHAKQEGVRFLWQVLPVRIHADPGGIRSVECVQVGVGDGGLLEPVAGSAFHFDCGQILYAIGQSPLLELLSAVRGVELNQGRVGVDRPTGRTSNPKYYAGGDCVNGGREVVDAVADGKRAGIALARQLEESARARAQEAAHA
ncbi:MAG TPA: NAD(P)-dependent oxidoreductase [Acidobacteriaceae bacterium]|jgi:glutamate synthase (NADPH/NADH) small chain|nr:NAD(P)-dependent oxidoreductase [Acidobacteriaceae bacterium]